MASAWSTSPRTRRVPGGTRAPAAGPPRAPRFACTCSCRACLPTWPHLATPRQPWHRLITRAAPALTHAHSQVVTNRKVNETYVLFQCGASTPDLTAFPEGAKFFQVRVFPLPTRRAGAAGGRRRCPPAAPLACSAFSSPWCCRARALRGPYPLCARGPAAVACLAQPLHGLHCSQCMPAVYWRQLLLPALTSTWLLAPLAGAPHLHLRPRDRALRLCGASPAPCPAGGGTPCHEAYLHGCLGAGAGLAHSCAQHHRADRASAWSPAHAGRVRGSRLGSQPPPCAHPGLADALHPPAVCAGVPGPGRPRARRLPLRDFGLRPGAAQVPRPHLPRLQRAEVRPRPRLPPPGGCALAQRRPAARMLGAGPLLASSAAGQAVLCPAMLTPARPSRCAYLAQS